VEQPGISVELSSKSRSRLQGLDELRHGTECSPDCSAAKSFVVADVNMAPCDLEYPCRYCTVSELYSLFESSMTVLFR
jgi:hypothetical protein